MPNVSGLDVKHQKRYEDKIYNSSFSLDLDRLQ